MKKLAVLIIAGMFALTACATIQPDRTNVANEYHYAVALEVQPLPQSLGELAHPKTLDLASLKSLMAQLVYVENSGSSDRGKSTPVFQIEEIERLAPSLVMALGQAQPEQLIRFVTFGQKKGVFFSDSQKTEGVFFVTSDQHVNFAFNFINSKRAPSETSAIYHRYAKLNPLDIQNSKKSLVAEKTGLELYRYEDGTQAPLWLHADLVTFERHLEEDDRYEVMATPSSYAGEISSAGEQVSAVQPESQAKMKRQDAIKQKLKFLKSLIDEGLITQKEYQEQKNKVLQAF